MDHQELLALNDRIKDLGKTLYNIAQEQDRLTGLIASCDSVFEQQVLDMGKSLPNVEARKVFKTHLQDSDSEYLQWTSELATLKLDLMQTRLERDGLKCDLDLKMLEIKRVNSKLEWDTLQMSIDQTNYLMTIKQQEDFSHSV